jgi:hypothetical protein
MAVLLGMLLGVLLVFGAALASIWLQQTRATQAESDTEAPASLRREASP